MSIVRLAQHVRYLIQFSALLAAASGLARADQPAPTSGFDSASAHIPMWQINSKTYGDLCFVGNPPTGAGTTQLPTPILPIKMELLDKNGNVAVVLDPMAPLSVPVNSDSAFTARDAVVFSPIFINQDWTVGPTDLGPVQWGEAVERASFWKYTGTHFKDWHIQMNASVLPEQRITVPNGSWAASPIPGVYEVDQFVLKFLRFSY